MCVESNHRRVGGFITHHIIGASQQHGMLCLTLRNATVTIEHQVPTYAIEEASIHTHHLKYIATVFHIELQTSHHTTQQQH